MRQLILILFTTCTLNLGYSDSHQQSMPTPSPSCKVSWYGKYFHGRLTASGSIYDMNKMTCAHKKLPFGTKVKFMHQGNSVILEVTDRGPYVKGREFDLSYAAAKELGFAEKGIAEVVYKILDETDEEVLDM